MKALFRNNMALATFIVLLALIVPFADGCKKNDTVTNSTPVSTGSTNQVVMQNSSFSPASLTVTAGTTVTWTNKDSYDHTVTSGTPSAPDGKFDSGNIASNKTFSFKFDTKGTYNYYCKIHPEIMVGSVVVQ
ncbi:MAG: plastocyanin/azurin family copper-binding protein [Syntrophomonadaceae bacterium]